MNFTGNGVTVLGNDIPRRDKMETPEEVAEMLRLRGFGWGTRRIAEKFGISRNTVRRYFRQSGWIPFQTSARQKTLDDLGSWLSEEFVQHRGNADVIRQELKKTHGIDVSLRTVERAVQPMRQEFEAKAKATVRFETPPGHQLQIDFGTKLIEINGQYIKVKLFVSTLGFSRRNFVATFNHERQSAWLDGLEGSFHYFGGVPEEVLLDNPRALVTDHDAQTRVVTFNERFLAFAKYWGFKARACAPYRAQTKGKDENGVGYVKKNAIAGHRFASWEEMEAHIAWWMREISDKRIHGTTGERPIVRFERAEFAALLPLSGRPPFRQIRELTRKVHNDCCVDVDTNHYSVPWRLIGEEVTVHVTDGFVIIFHAGTEMARHTESGGRRERVLQKSHFDGVSIGPSIQRGEPTNPEAMLDQKVLPELLRPLSEYEAATGAHW